MRRGGRNRRDLARGAGVETGAAPGLRARSPWVFDVLGVLWTVAAAAAVLAPALRPGITLGPFDLLTRFGLTRHPGVAVHNALQQDQIEQFVPWMNLAWHQVHAGHLPLWNPYNVLGMPLAFNWQSGVFSVPALVGYLFPLTYAYTAMVLTKLVIAGTGAYALSRVLGLGPLPAAFAGTAFELSGPIIVHAPWPHTAVTGMAGWILTAVVGLLRGKHRGGNVVLLAGAVGLAVYGGHPESLVVTGVAVVLFAAVFLAVRARSGGGPLARPLGDMAVGAGWGLALGAPLLLPGVQLGLASVRRYAPGTAAYPLSHVTNLLAAGLQGNDFTTTAYVGVVVLALAAVGTRTSWRRPEVRALAAVAVVAALLTFFSPVDQVLHLVPGGRTVTWSRAVMVLALVLAVLGAYGIDALLRATDDLTAVRWAAGAFAALGVVVLGLALASLIGLAPAVRRHEASLLWPAVQSVVGLALAGAWWRWRRPAAHTSAGPRRHARFGTALLVALETGFLLSAGIPSWSVGSSYFATNPAVTTLQRTVGSSLVGYGSCLSLRYLSPSAKEVGIRPDANIGYGVREMAVYDPILPDSYLRAWLAISGQHTPPVLAAVGFFCARINTVTEARILGVRYVLEPPGRAGPSGSVRVRSIGNETVYSIPGAADATVAALSSGGVPLPTDAPGTPVAVTHPDPASWRLVTDPAATSVLRLRLTDVPGWNASIDGRPLALGPWAGGMMLEARVPPGRHVVDVHYWPSAFNAGLAVGGAVTAAVALVAGGGVLGSRRRRRRAAPAS